MTVGQVMVLGINVSFSAFPSICTSKYLIVCAWNQTQVLYVSTQVCYSLGHSGCYLGNLINTMSSFTDIILSIIQLPLLTCLSINMHIKILNQKYPKPMYEVSVMCSFAVTNDVFLQARGVYIVFVRS